MPLKRGSSREVISENIKEIVDKWKRTGRIGNSRPKTKKEAVRQAVAIALSTARKYKNNRKRRRKQ